MKLKIDLDFKYHKGQQIWILLLAIIPGALVYFKYITSTTGGLLVLLLYYVSKRHMKEMRRQSDNEERARRQEEQRLAALPTKARKNIEKRKLKERQLEGGNAGSSTGVPGSAEEDKKKDS